MIPEMNGYEAVREIRIFNPEVVLFAQTAYAITGERENALAAGCNDYLAKPLKPAELRNLIISYF